MTGARSPGPATGAGPAAIQGPATSPPAGPPRVDLVLAPTPLHRAGRLSHEVGVEIYFKRDDLTGAGLGGNKLRGLEFLIADALGQGCDTLVTGAGPQSNWTLLAALACLRYGIEPHVVCYGSAPARAEGNLRLHRWLGVDVRFTGSPERCSVDEGIAAVTARLRAAGRRPYPVPRGGATPLGAFGYVRASAELAAQLAGLDPPPAGLWLATGSGGTHAGLLAGAALARAAYHIVGVTVSRPAAEAQARVRELAAAAAELAAADRTGPDGRSPHPGRQPPPPDGRLPHSPLPEPDVRDGWIGPGYGIPSAAGQAAARLVAMTEGVFLDPVFAAKAMAALLAAARAGELHGPQLFLVSGGAPTLFAGTALDAAVPGEGQAP